MTRVRSKSIHRPTKLANLAGHANRPPAPLALLPSRLAGSPPGAAASTTPLTLLDDPGEWSAFSRARAGQPGCWESSVVFAGMHCGACALTIEDALRQVPGVLSANVSAASHRGRIVWSDGTVKPSGWMQAAARVGYPAVPLPVTAGALKPARRCGVWGWQVFA